MKLSKKQNEFWRNCHHRWNIKEGAVRSGKTYMDYILIAKRIRATHGKEGLRIILGHTHSTIERNIIEPMRDIWGENLIGKIRGNFLTMFGEKVYLIGADKVSQMKKLQGAGFIYCYGDEITTWNEEVFQMVKSRLSFKDSVFDGTCNPDSPNHWFKKFLDKGKSEDLNERIDIYSQKYIIDENPFLDPEFVSNLKKEYAGTIYYDRFILGQWTLAEGIIYACFDPVRDPLDEVPEPLNGRKIVAVDYGTSNACVFLLYEQGVSGCWYHTDEYYYSGRDEIRQKTDEEYCQDFDKFVEGKYIETIVVDPSAASFIVALRQHGHTVTEADNAVLDGIRRTMVMLNSKELMILKKCTHTLDEIGTYRWNPKGEKDEPIKEKDHCMDAMRYFVNHITNNLDPTLPNHIPTVQSTWSGFYGYGNGSYF